MEDFKKILMNASLALTGFSVATLVFSIAPQSTGCIAGSIGVVGIIASMILDR